MGALLFNFITTTLIVSFYLIVLVSSDTSCIFNLKNHSVIDLSSIGKTGDIPLFYYLPVQIENETVSELISYNPCYSIFDKSGLSPPENERSCANAAGCVLRFGKTDGTLPTSYAIGLQKTAQHEENTTNISIIYKTDSPKSLSNLTVYLTCNENEKHTLTITHEGPNYEVILSGKCACPDKCISKPDVNNKPHGLSTGSGLLIAFFVIFSVYFLGGMLYKYCNGAHGLELLPHSAFWTDLPQLITDGFLYTCSCFSRPSQSNYNDM